MYQVECVDLFGFDFDPLSKEVTRLRDKLLAPSLGKNVTIFSNLLVMSLETT
jgi:hypothetical protein